MKAQLEGGAVDVWVVNVALTATGLTKFGITDEERLQFSAEFREGMAPEPAPGSDVTPRRCNLLGDVGKNSPEYWQWGGWSANREIDGILLLYAAAKAELEKLIKYEIEAAQKYGIRLLESGREGKGDPLILRGQIYKDLKEHFGFRDGISQPIIDGTPASTSDQICKNPNEARISLVMPGEFVLGYLNERGTRVGRLGSRCARRTFEGEQIIARPHPQRHPSRFPATRTRRRRISSVTRYGRPSSFGEKTERNIEENREWVMARLVGRKRSGEPLVPPSTYPSKKQTDQENDKSPRTDLLTFL